jgi:CheY-like chemotaxis protein
MQTQADVRRGVKVLVVDDDDANREAMALALARAGFDVVAAETGADAVALARAHAPDVLVLDVFLPDAGGLGVARAVGRGDGVPVLYVTGLSSPAVLDALAPAPVLLKPFTRRDLVRHVSDLARAP